MNKAVFLIQDSFCIPVLCQNMPYTDEWREGILRSKLRDQTIKYDHWIYLILLNGGILLGVAWAVVQPTGLGRICHWGPRIDFRNRCIRFNCNICSMAIGRIL
jgi:hypothetical protein